MSAHSMRSLQEPSRLGTAFIAALLLHVSALTAMTFWPHAKDSLPGEQEITIDLAPAMEEVASVAPAEISAVEAPPVEPAPVPLEPENVEPPLEEVTAEQPQDVAELPEPQKATEAPPVKAEMAPEPEPVVALPPPETVVAKSIQEPPPSNPKPKPERKPLPPNPVERKPPPRRTAAQQAQPPSEARQGQASSSRENMEGAAAAADPSALNRYRAALYAAVRSRLRYPPSAESQGISGTAEIRFTLDRSGQVLNVSLVRSTGNPLLDQAALATARPGSSLPAAPASVPQQQFTVTAPLRFNPR
ncbi:TonB family protein [Microvirga sp. SYSU G3D207]|uniref:Protein TonB n=2 Tax=Microvirga arsenatis TaxID=2692265 RepID=A0ABW9Z081_9HYPH|nr:TonB family protein [Microvirga arsenatis]NBJ25346.1 TonB family protein [Microvirga arsenatis]